MSKGKYFRYYGVFCCFSYDNAAADPFMPLQLASLLTTCGANSTSLSCDWDAFLMP